MHEKLGGPEAWKGQPVSLLEMSSAVNVTMSLLVDLHCLAFACSLISSACVLMFVRAFV